MARSSRLATRAGVTASRSRGIWADKAHRNPRRPSASVPSSGLPPKQPSDDGAEELVWGTSGLVPCASAWTARTRAERSWGSSRRRRHPSQGLPRPRRSALSIPARAPWYSDIPRSAASCAPDSHSAARPNRPRARYLSRYPISTLQRVIAFARWRALRSGARSPPTPRASPALPLPRSARRPSRRVPFRVYRLSRST